MAVDAPRSDLIAAAVQRPVTVLVGVVLGATTGIVGATVITLGLLTLPALLKRGYEPGIACGAITEEEAMATGITLDELHGRSFIKIVQNRAYKKTL